MKTAREWAHSMADVDNHTLGGAVLALTGDDKETAQIVGVARLARARGKVDDPQAEAAIVIRNDYHRQGVGLELLRRLVRLAKQMNVREIVAHFEAYNTPAIRLFRKLSLPSTEETSYGVTTMTIQMPE